MTMRRNGNGILIGGGALLVGVLTFGVVLGKTIGGGTSLDAAPTGREIAGQAQPRQGTSTDLTSSALSPEVLVLAVDRAPFQEDRLRPSTPYRLPGAEPEPAPRSEVPPPPPAPDFQLIGAVSGANGGWAIVRVGDGTPQMIAVGESMEGYVLDNVRGERAVMASADRSISLALAGPSPEVRVQGRGGNQGRGGGAAANQGRAGGAAANQGGAAAVTIPTNVMELLQGQGINPAAILQQLQQGGNVNQILQRLTGAAAGGAAGQGTITPNGNVQIPAAGAFGGRGGGGRGGGGGGQ